MRKGFASWLFVRWAAAALAFLCVAPGCRTAQAPRETARRPVPPALRRAGWTAEQTRVGAAVPGGYAMQDIVLFRNSLGMEFALVPPGEFLMGDPLSPEEAEARWPSARAEWFADARPRRRVSIERPFLIGVHEVTRGQFARFAQETAYITDAEREGAAWTLRGRRWERVPGASWRNPGFPQDDTHPAVCVSWNDAAAFCEWLSQKEGLRYRLPTEAEWEYAACGGERAHDGETPDDGASEPGGSGGDLAPIWPWGGDEEAAQGRANVAGSGEALPWETRFRGVSGGPTWTAPVGSFAPNALGLHDVIGNAAEWCLDWYAPDAYAGEDAASPLGPPEGRRRVLRGGAWGQGPAVARLAFRDAARPSAAHAANGFRVVVEIPE